MKTTVLSFLLLLGGLVSTFAAPVNISVGYSDPIGTAPPLPRTPILNVDLTDGVLTFQDSHADFALQVLDENGVVVYSTAVPSTQTTVILPSWLSGEFELRLYPTGSNLYFYGWIEL